jgi:hypothetical protein
MKNETFPGYTYAIDGKVYVNPNLRPEQPKNMSENHNEDWYKLDYENWLKDCIEVENAEWMQPELGSIGADGWKQEEQLEGFWLIDLGLAKMGFRDGDECTFKMSGKKSIVTSLK